MAFLCSPPWAEMLLRSLQARMDSRWVVWIEEEEGEEVAQSDEVVEEEVSHRVASLPQMALKRLVLHWHH